eukprot:CAMPEP_0206167200 /NCGR_PEP_ID=MMETSP1474-20131121/27255_1 /ASSEMBLY_ACC=CAM_ASM_001110 /TAXON_ID=97495 /ORGANISM="Imantonia sp., Strain RCC918" /LENGTH=51 /DNA_ID=CAMNT_0053571699 /DNA_START=86 /DNA_END=237 /DNA_ORIENTATION=+
MQLSDCGVMGADDWRHRSRLTCFSPPNARGDEPVEAFEVERWVVLVDVSFA